MTKQLDGFQKAFDILRLRSEDALRRKQSELNYEYRLKLTGIIVAARCILSENIITLSPIKNPAKLPSKFALNM